MINLPKSYVARLGTRHPMVCSLRPYPLGQQAWFTYCPVVEYTNFFLNFRRYNSRRHENEAKLLPTMHSLQTAEILQNICPCTVDCSVGFLARQCLQEMQIYSPGERGREGK